MNKIVSLVLFGALMIACPVALAQGTITEIFPNSKTIWEQNYQGDLVDFAITEESEDIIAVTQEQDRFHLYYINPNGKQMWERTVIFKQPEYQKLDFLKISSNGETIVVCGTDVYGECPLTWVYDNIGTLLFSAEKEKGLYLPSPKGNYLLFQKILGFSSFKIFNRYGKPLQLNIPPVLEGSDMIQKFVSETEVLVYKKNIINQKAEPELLLVIIPNISVKWSIKLEKELWLVDFNNRNTAISDKYIAIQGTDPGTIYLFKKSNGELLWKIDEPKANSGLAFISDEKHLVSLSNNHTLYIIESENGNIVSKKKLFEIGGFSGVPKISFEAGKLVIHARSYFYMEKFNPNKPISGEVYSFVIDFNKSWGVIKQNFLPERFIIYASKKDLRTYLIGQPYQSKRVLIKNSITNN